MADYTADFETTTDENDCRVWAYGICNIDNTDDFIYGNDIDEFLNFCRKKENHNIYFHNLKFDGEFIISRLLNLGFEHIEDKKQKRDKTFCTLISEMGQFYSIVVYFEVKNKKVNKVTFFDSLKILPFSVDKIAKSFNLEISKLKIDYDEKREKGHILTKEEVDYLRNDVTIVAKALRILFNENLKQMTQGSNAIHDFKKMVGDKFTHYFPVLKYEIEHDIRKSYKGGFTYCNPDFQFENYGEVGKGIVLDVNSLYPSVMYEKPLPYGEPIYFDGKYQDDFIYDLYVQRLTCYFNIKKGYIPTIQIKNNFNFKANEYLTSSGDIEPVTLTLTNVDLKLFFEHYDVEVIEWHGGWKFKSIKGLFCKYIDKWIERKIQAKKDKNGGLYTLSKLMLNSLYGKFALNPDVISKFPYLGDDGIVHYRKSEKEIRDGIYIPVGTFITAYAREKTICSAQKVKERFCYSDTDSIHLIGTDLPEELEIDDYKLGAWKLETVFDRAKFIRQKCYQEDGHDAGEKDAINEIKTTCAGLPKSCLKHVNWENFKIGFSCPDKLVYKHVPRWYCFS